MNTQPVDPTPLPPEGPLTSGNAPAPGSSPSPAVPLPPVDSPLPAGPPPACDAGPPMQSGEAAARSAATGPAPRHVTWIHDRADLVGGGEQYIARTVAMLRDRGVRSSLLYDPNGPVSTSFLRRFESAFPLVDVDSQLADLGTDLVYAHKLRGAETARRLAASDLPVVRFFHDHRLFCLREHKYTTLTQRTCTRTTGLGCYACLGFVNRDESLLGFRLRTLGDLKQEQAANRRLDAFVVGSEYMAEHIAAHGFDRQRVHVNPLFVPPLPPRAAVARRDDTLLFVGQLVRGKGLDVLLEALARAGGDCRLRVVGRGRQEGEYRTQAARLGIADRVEFCGRASDEQLAEQYATSTCLVVPSRAPETFALVGVEALQHGLPVIASHVGGIGEWLHHERTGLSVPPDDSAALAAAVTRMLADAPLRTRLGEEGRRLVAERFAPRRHIDELLVLFRSLVDSEVPRDAS